MPELRQRMEQLPDARAEQCMEQLLDTPERGPIAQMTKSCERVQARTRRAP
jgi:hypothetical protein